MGGENKVNKRDWLIQRRVEQGYTQKDLAKKLNVSNRTISKVELGLGNPSGQLAVKWAMVLGFDMTYFYINQKSA